MVRIRLPLTVALLNTCRESRERARMRTLADRFPFAPNLTFPALSPPVTITEERGGGMFRGMKEDGEREQRRRGKKNEIRSEKQIGNERKWVKSE